ncbi:EamA family transporter [Erythrobacter arachoides]|uniref:EamA family transporter n=2 Tax=Aurantiacibacter arachoides TaxID=1850444 RepID=A0A845A3M7_9SPHN|nr:EamA family transporter [Aurantiacibacter arachoides]GGD48669.1 permease [Aurantiacibacter arachoides]
MQSDRAGLLYALAGFCLLSLGDAIIKGIADQWTPPAVAAFRYVLGAIGLSAILFAREGSAPFTSIPKLRVQLLRGAAVATATLAFFGSIWLMPLADAVAITFTQPMFTALLAALFLGERLRWATVAATLVAFVGVLIILRPNFAAIGVAALLPLLSALAMAVLMTANRAVRGVGSVLAAQAYVACGGALVLMLAAGAGAASGDPRFALYWPEWHVLARVAFVACSATAAHWLVFKGTERAGAATVAPMTYGQLLVATSLAWVFFDEAPDAIAMLGAALIVGSGLWLWWRGRAKDLSGSTR